nr:DNA-directed DNA polymerase [Tanacetum cinerariifolium]
MADNRTMKELLQAPTKGYGEAIVIPEINVDHFEIKKILLQLVQANPYHGFERENPHTHINNFKRITLSLKFRDVPNDVIKLMMSSYSLEGSARVWYDKEPPNSILTWEDLVNKFVNQFFPPSKTTHLKNEISRFTQRFEETFGEAWERFKEMLKACPHHGFTELAQIDTFYNGLNDNDQDSLNAAAGENLLSKTTREALQIIENKSKDQASTLGTLLSNTIPNPKGEMKAITTRSGVAYEGPSIPTNPSPKKVVERETEETTDKEQINLLGITAHIQPPVTPILEPDVPKTLPNTNIPYPSRLNDQNLCEKATNQMEKFFQIFQDLHFDITMLLKKLLEKLGDPGKFLIPCDFSGMDVCHALADLGASINLMPLSIWIKLSLPEVTPTRMTLELADRSITHPKGVAEDVFIRVGKFYFSTNFVVVDFKADPRLIEKLLNNDPFQLPPMDLKQREVVKAKSSIEEPSELELKDLPSHLEYAYLEGVDKLPVIIAKDLKDNEKEALLKVLKSHKRAIAWKITDIKGIDPRFCIHKILMEEDYKPAVQSQRRVNPKIHEVIKKEVIKLLDARMIYPISDSPWVSHIHYVPKKGGITAVENENYELIPTQLVTRWRVCNDYWKLNDATRKDHFPLPFIDKMLERLVGNEFYCFIEGFSGYFQILINPPDQRKTTFTYCIVSFETLKKKLTEAPILVVPDRNLPFELMCDASDFTIGAVLGQCKTKNFQPIHYASKTMTEAQTQYTMTEKEMLAVVLDLNNQSLKRSKELFKLHNPRVGSTTLNDKVIVTLSSLKCKHLQQGQLRYISSGNSLSLAVAKYSNSRIFITSSRNDLEHFIPNILNFR